VVDEPAWATRFRFEQAGLLERFASEFGEGVVTRIEGRVRASSLKKITELVDQHPEQAVNIMRQWMYQEA